MRHNALIAYDEIWLSHYRVSRRLLKFRQSITFRTSLTADAVNVQTKRTFSNRFFRSTSMQLKPLLCGCKNFSRESFSKVLSKSLMRMLFVSRIALTAQISHGTTFSNSICLVFLYFWRNFSVRNKLKRMSESEYIHVIGRSGGVWTCMCNKFLFRKTLATDLNGIFMCNNKLKICSVITSVASEQKKRAVVGSLIMLTHIRNLPGPVGTSPYVRMKFTKWKRQSRDWINRYCFSVSSSWSSSHDRCHWQAVY